MEDKCNSEGSHGGGTKEPDFLSTSNTSKSVKEDECLESRASFVGPSLSATIGASKPAKIIETARLATAKGASTRVLVLMFLRKVRMIILDNKEPGEQLLEMLQLLEKDEPTIDHKTVLHHLKKAGCKKKCSVCVPHDQIVKH
ncbi:hypothetical protein V1477_000099 [Vespula maculifrons]|uniref:Uncharacterized protein n=1 Tax=Vespula maculifrons TaxID=7453 RepID=A0ABD2D439_VESMC